MRAHDLNVLVRSLLWSSKLHGRKYEKSEKEITLYIISYSEHQINKQYNVEKKKREISLCGFCIFLAKRSSRKPVALHDKALTK